MGTDCGWLIDSSPEPQSVDSSADYSKAYPLAAQPYSLATGAVALHLSRLPRPFQESDLSCAPPEFHLT